MSVWCLVKGSIARPYKAVSIRKLVAELFDEHGGVFLVEGTNTDIFEFTFCDEGISAAKLVEKFCSVLKENKIRADIIAEVRFLT